MKSVKFKELGPRTPPMPSKNYAKSSATQRVELSRCSNTSTVLVLTLEARETGGIAAACVASFDRLLLTWLRCRVLLTQLGPEAIRVQHTQVDLNGHRVPPSTTASRKYGHGGIWLSWLGF
jgi:hypothetical protein